MARRETDQDVGTGAPHDPIRGHEDDGPPELPELPGAPVLPPAPFDYNSLRTPDWGQIGNLERRTPEELAALNQVTSLAQWLQGSGESVYNVGMPAYTQAMNYISTILGPSKAGAARAIGPQAGGISDVYAGAQRSLEASGLRGGALDQVRANLQTQRARDIGNLIPQAQQAALGTAVSGGLAGINTGLGANQAAAGLQQNLLQIGQANRQFAISAEAQNRLGAAGIITQNRGIDAGFASSIFGTETSGTLGLAGLEQSGYFGERSADLADQQFAAQTAYQQQLLDLQRQQLQAQQSAAHGAKWGGLLGTAVTTGLSFIPGVGPAASAGAGLAGSGKGGPSGGGGFGAGGFHV